MTSSYNFCLSCKEAGKLPLVVACGQRTGNPCMDKHRRGAKATHTHHRNPSRDPKSDFAKKRRTFYGSSPQKSGSQPGKKSAKRGRKAGAQPTF